MAAVQSVTASEAIFSALNVSRDKPDAAEGVMQDRFLKLLVTQLRNQDPLNPMDNAQMTSQMAQISTVDGIEKLNMTLQALMANANDSQAVQAAVLVGHGVLVPGSGLALSEGTAIGGYELAEPADRTIVTIKDASGLVVRTLDLGAGTTGSHVFRWDGTTDNGTPLADGRYSFAVKANRGDASLTPPALELGIVTGVSRGAAGVSVDVGGLGQYRLDQVKQII